MRCSNQPSASRRLKGRTLLGTALSGVLTGGLGGLAGLGLVSEAASAQVMMDEITVTARKREEGSQDVPVSVTALSGSAIRDLGFEDSTSIASQVPNFSFGTPVGEGNNPGFSLRGVGLNDFGDGNESPVAMYVDGTYLGTLAGQTIQIFDVERVEVLRGPQGTLYGRNATAGLVHFISRKPTPELEGFAKLDVAEFGEVRFEGGIGGPLSDTVRGRVSGVYQKDNGFVTNRLDPDQDANNTDFYSVRGQLEWAPSDTANVLLIGHAGQVDQFAPYYDHVGILDENFAPCSNERILNDECQDVTGYRDADGDIYTGDFDRQGVLEVDTAGVSATVNLTLGGVDLTSITAWESVEKLHEEDTDVGPNPYLVPTFGVDSDQFSEELRLSGSTPKLNWVLGAYYYTDEKDGRADLLVNNELDDFLIDVGAAPPPSVVPVLLDYRGLYTIETESIALFGQADYAITPDLELTLGLRYTDEEKRMDFESTINGATGPGTGGERKTSFDDVSGKVGLTYNVTPDNMLFASVARGFKSGGFNATFIFDEAGFTPYDKETLTSYEVGSKNSMFGGRLRFNLTGFYYDYEDSQALLNINLEGGGATSILTNIPQVEVYGMEAEVVANPFEGFETTLGAGLMDSKVKRVLPGNEDLLGSELTFAPNATLNGVFRYYQPMGNAGELSYQVDFTYQSEQFFSLDNDPLLSQDGYSIWNARITYAGDNGRYKVSAFVNNLFDKEYTTFKFPFFEDGFFQQMIGHPQWFGGSIEFNF
ncbi:TonB-dependent receptor [Yunchengibacter salinarum]|uniref:TonB-dependent receptor n=1 Tax=Yunchengibacter salinarum TaxID=3133399 RepID=UPI0035B58BA4